MSYLIIGLGNPGSTYKETRHNVGFLVLQAFAAKQGWGFKTDSDVEGEIAHGSIGGNKVRLLKPLTFMNRSGEAVRACIAKFKVPLDRCLVISDDVALPLGTLRLRSKGSAGGHNGLKSIETHLGTEYYARLRVGVGSPETQVLSDYVLDSFSRDEKEVVEESIQKALLVLDTWLQEGMPAAMQRANARKKSGSTDEEGLEEGDENG